MVYVGNKTRLLPDLIPILQKDIDEHEYQCYIEPFVGGANVIGKIRNISRIGGDTNPYLIGFLNRAKQPDCPDWPIITKEQYDDIRTHKDQYEDWEVGNAAYNYTFRGKYFGGFIGDKRMFEVEARFRHLKRQQPDIETVRFIHCSYTHWEGKRNCIFYCDPPYKDSTKYNQENFDSEKFYDFCVELAKHNTVYVSEYVVNRPEFELIYEKKIDNFMKLADKVAPKANEMVYKIKN